MINQVKAEADKIKGHLGEEDEIDDKLAKNKTLFDDFSKDSEEKGSLIDDFKKLHGDNVTGFEDMKRKLAEADDKLNQLEAAYGAQNGNPDFELKQKQVQ